METLNLKIKGLYTSPNQFSETPEGALNEALGCVIDKPSIAECRRGQALYGTLDGVPDKMFSFQGTLLLHYLNKMAYDANGNGSFSDYTGSFDPPNNLVRIHSFEGNRNFYITTFRGIKKLDDIQGQFRDAGMVKALYGTASLTSPGFMSDQVQVAYRMVWGYTDANNNEIVGAPSQRLVVINDTGDTCDVTMVWQIPEGITTSYFFRVYRSGESAGVDSPPDDEMQQVKEGNPTSADISSGEFTFTDIVPNSLRGATLYTSPSQEGIAGSNDQPPFALDISLFRNCAFYFNTKSKQRYFFTLISVGDNTLGGSFGYQTNNGTTHTNTSITGLTLAASAIIQDLTYTADATGVYGNDISITYIGGGTAGSEVVTVSTNDITVEIEDNVSTATQVKAALDGNVPASALISVAISGTGSDAQVITAQTFLSDGFDTSFLNIGMRVIGTGVQSGTTIVSIDSISAITVTPATTASATVAMIFQDGFRINSMTYWAASSADYNNRQFIAVLTGTPGENIEDTALNLVAAINRDPNNSIVYAYYQSGQTDLPGEILLEERSIGGDEFAITSTNGESFSPVLSNTGDSNVSDNDAHQNRVMISKIQQPEAVPLLNFLPVGSENFPIVRGISLRDSVFVFKPGEGIFRITGTDTSNFTVSLFDSSAHIRAPESCVVLNNQVFCFSDQGIIVVSESGVQIISIPIEGTLLRLSSAQYANFDTASFGVSYESDRKYLFFTVSSVDDVYATQAFIFNTITNSFTQWMMPRSCGIVLSSNDILYMGNQEETAVYKERKNYNRTDYADNEFTVEIIDYDDYEIELNDATDALVGDLLKQGGLEAYVTELVDDTHILVSNLEEWDLDDASLLQGIDISLEWVPNTASNPGILKQFPECTLLFKESTFRTIDVGFQTNLITPFEEITLSSSNAAGWGLFPWGLAPWGIGGGGSVSLRTYVPRQMQRGSWINFRVRMRQAYSNFSLAGISAIYNQMTSRQR